MREGRGSLDGTAGVTRVDTLTADPKYTVLGLTRIFASGREHHSHAIGNAEMPRGGGRLKPVI
jgi:hypothetical protein